MKKGDKFECDLKEVLKGMSNIFMRIFQSMNGLNGEKLSSDQIFNTALKNANGGLMIPGEKSKSDELKSSHHSEDTEFWLNSLNTSFFLNHYFERYLIFFERVSFEFPNFKYVLFDVFQEKAGISHEECNINDSRNYD